MNGKGFHAAIWGAAIAYFLLILFLSILKIQSFKGTFDLAVFHQLFWMMHHHGAPYITSAPPYETLHWFGWHFSPILYGILPFYIVFPSPFTLQVIQCACYALAMVPIAYLCRHLKYSHSVIALAVALFYFNPLYINAALWDFHEVSLACLWIAIALWALVVKRKDWFLLALLLLVLTKEHYGLSVAGFGVLWAWHHRDWRFGFAVACAGLLTLVLVLKIIMPWLNGGLPHPMLRGEMGDKTTSRYHWILSGESPRAVWDQWWRLFYFGASPFSVSGIYYLFGLFLTVCFLPLLAPMYLLPAASDLVAALLSLNQLPRLFYAYHSAPLIPILVTAAVIGMRHNRMNWPLEKIPLAVFVTFVLVNTSFYLWEDKLRGMHIYELGLHQPRIETVLAREAQSIVGQGSVSVQPNISHLFSGRQTLYPFPVRWADSDFIVLHLYHPYGWIEKSPFIYMKSTVKHYTMVYDILNEHPEYGIRYWQDNWLVLEKNAPDIAPVRKDVIEHVLTILKSGWNPP